jgi:hypothetical protein
MRRRRWVIPAGAVGAALLIAAVAGVVGGLSIALSEGDTGAAKP